ncbi:MAG: NAD(P)H-dependent oxidoreductase [Caulobacterales bacterium]|nr:NAD(P)H-dependent oxidoreductase [Caulobacterales bacterium]
MKTPKILTLSGSLRPQSFNTALAELAAREFAARGAQVTRCSLSNFSMPIYDARIEAEGIPESAISLHSLFSAHDGIFIASPEYNSFPPPLLLNALDWMSRVRHNEGGMAEAFETPVFAIGSASPSPVGGYRALTAFRQKLSLGLGAFVAPAMVAVAAAYQAFDQEGNLVAERDKAALKKVVGQLLDRIDG